MTITQYRRKADRSYQEKYRAKRCEVCGRHAQVVHHFFPKSIASSLRYDKGNGVSLCNVCHFKHHNGDPSIHARILKIRGDKWFKELEERRKKKVRITVDYFKKVIGDKRS